MVATPGFGVVGVDAPGTVKVTPSPSLSSAVSDDSLFDDCFCDVALSTAEKTGSSVAPTGYAWSTLLPRSAA
ncbi:Uncharacterised protein [Mycobacteroides abscessus subsp. abscessus]|nr:Uncharacterised protein [Mycobacteroides abscessus subsp. abscessus]